jgi:histidine triad (HIT) family protein
MSEVTIFEKIIKKEIPANIVFENQLVMGFKDLAPQAPVHILFIHKQKTVDIGELAQQKPDQLVELFQAITMFVKMQGLDQTGYRLVSNKGGDAGQTVFYTHIHLLAGEKLGKFGI